MTTTILPTNAIKAWLFSQNSDGTLSPATIGGGGGTGTVTSLTGTSPVVATPTTITTTGAFSCPTCTTNAAALTSGNVVSGAGLQAAQDSGIATSTLVTSASALTSNAIVLGAGSQGTKVVAGITTDGVSVLNLGGIGAGNGRVNFNGNTSGQSSAIVNSTGTAVTFSGNVLAAILSGNTLQSTVATGTPPLSITSTTNVANLNASSLSGATFASPGAIGGTTPNTIKFTTLTATTLLYSNAAPTISSGFFGTSPSVASNNGTASFRINVGTGVAASAGVVGLATATNGWNCQVYNFTARGTTRTDNTFVSASSTNSVTFTNQTVATGAPINWTASDVLVANCFAY